MGEISDYHKYLFYGKLTNSLSSQEVEELNELFLIDADALAYFQELKEAIPYSDKNDQYNKLAEPGFWKDVKPRSEKHRKSYAKIFPIKSISAAAAILLLLVSTLLIYNNKKNITVTAPVAKQEFVKLRTADGQLINLSEQKGVINQGNLTLTNEVNTLSYKNKEAESRGINSVTVPTGKDYHIILEDGSKVWMNSTTTVHFPSVFGSDKREITISGEAYIEVAKDSKRPFIVHLPNSSVKVLGTEFNVNTYDTLQIKVALVNGAVNFISGQQTLKIRKGYMGVLTNKQLLERTFNTSSVLSWRKGLFFFEESNLDEIAPVLKRWFGVSIKIDRPEIRKKEFVGALDKNQPIEQFLYHLKTISNIDSYFDKDGVLHFK